MINVAALCLTKRAQELLATHSFTDNWKQFFSICFLYTSSIHHISAGRTSSSLAFINEYLYHSRETASHLSKTVIHMTLLRGAIGMETDNGKISKSRSMTAL
jgi:hypothetical protein